MKFDSFDLRILRALQADSEQDRAGLADRVGLSPSQVARRRQALEAAGVIRGYRAELDPRLLGVPVLVFITVRLREHSPEHAERFMSLVNALPAVQEAHMLTGESDYELKVRVRDLDELARLVNERLLAHANVDRVKSNIVLRTLKESPGLPIGDA
jgi:DNA-binding Lrp family transcriptional regulator